MKRFVWIALILQVVMVVAGHFSTAVVNLSAILGTGIPFVVALWYGAAKKPPYTAGAKGGFVIGIVGAVVGVLVAILMGDQPWSLLAFAPLSSGVTGLLGGVIGALIGGRNSA
jgi:hypothetical protein